jgi:hypothetical protein
MEKRAILRKTKSVKKAEKVDEIKEVKNIDEEETFEPEIPHLLDPPKEEPRTRSLKSEEIEEIKEIKKELVLEVKPKKDITEDKYTHLQNARAKSLETRRKRKEEQVRLKIQAEELQRQLLEQREENKKLSLMKSKSALPMGEISSKENIKNYSNEFEPQPPTRSIKKEKEELDYDKLAEHIYGKFSNNFKQMEMGIREQERLLAEKKYKEDLKAYEDKRNQTRERMPLYTSNRKKPNRAFDSMTASYWGK